MSPVLLLIIMFVCSALGGMIWGMIPGVFKAYWNTNETLFTLMLNYVAMQIVTFCIVFWENPKGSNTVGIINQTTQAGWLPELFRTEIRMECPDRSCIYSCDVYLPEIQQAGL